MQVPHSPPGLDHWPVPPGTVHSKEDGDAAERGTIINPTATVAWPAPIAEEASVQGSWVAPS
jgi:hypothetical protein